MNATSTETSDKLQLDIREHTALMTINNPPANTWDGENLRGLLSILETLKNNSDIYALVITGSGDKFFSAGADLNQFAQGDKNIASTVANEFSQAFEALADFPGVSIAAINGFAMGGGLEVALACDIRIAETHAQLALPETKVGLLPCGGGTQRLSWLVGEGWAKRLILCGERINAKTAEKIGLVEEVVDQGESLNTALSLAAKVAGQSPTAVRYSKALIHAARDTAFGSALIAERQRFIDLFDGQDQVEGVNAFLEKRKAEWKNC